MKQALLMIGDPESNTRYIIDIEGTANDTFEGTTKAGCAALLIQAVEVEPLEELENRLLDEMRKRGGMTWTQIGKFILAQEAPEKLKKMLEHKMLAQHAVNQTKSKE